MDIKIKLTPEELRAQSGNMSTLMQEYESLFSGTKTILESTNANWSSNLANNFAGKIITAQKGFSEVVAILRFGMEAARTGAEHFDTIDKSMAKEISDDSQGSANVTGARGTPVAKTLGKDTSERKAKLSALIASIVATIEAHKGSTEEETGKPSILQRIKNRIEAILHPDESNDNETSSNTSTGYSSYTLIPDEEVRKIVEGNHPQKEGGWHGACSAYVNKILRNEGICTYNEYNEYSKYAKDYAQKLADKGITKTGYTCTGYTGSTGLDDLIAAHPNEPITNVVISMSAGSAMATDTTNGHVVLIQLIQDGKLYFTESCSAYGIPEGKMWCITVEEFKKRYFTKDNGNLMGVTHLHK